MRHATDLGWLLALALIVGPSPAGAEVQVQGFSEGGDQGCLACHATAAMAGITHTRHQTVACEVCHGGAADHARDPTRYPRPSVDFGKSLAEMAATHNDQCLQCHRAPARANWPHSAHERLAVRCVDCHTLHRDRDPVLDRQSQDEVCVACHRHQRMELHKRSAHPIAAGKMACSDCHAVHGTLTDKLLKGTTANQTCYVCHADKRGPFLWEHAPVREDCMSCHVAHGSAQPALLKARVPFLCQQCHTMAGHPSTALDSGALTPGQLNNRFVLAKGCLNCHPQVHGSNHPSGVKLNR